MAAPSNGGSLWFHTDCSPVARLWRPQVAQGRRVALTDPAEYVLTDFTREAPATVTEDRPVREALLDMRVAGVHSLLVVHGDAVTGLITAHRIQRECLPDLRRGSSTGHEELEVGHIMTPWNQVTKLDWSCVRVADVGDVAETFRCTQATHLVVVEHRKQDGAFVRAVISRARLGRQLGMFE